MPGPKPSPELTPASRPNRTLPAKRRQLFPVRSASAVWLTAVILFSAAGTFAAAQAPAPAWRGLVENDQHQRAASATVELQAKGQASLTSPVHDGQFTFNTIPPQTYQVVITVDGRAYQSKSELKIPPESATALITLHSDGTFTLTAEQATASAGGEQLSSKTVTEIPLNKRDFSQLLLLAAGTAADPSGAANFTQQFAINGQRGVEATFALDGADISDPEQGGGTFTNFNVDAVSEIQSLSGVMPAEVGRGASGFTNIVTRSGEQGFHGSVFEFLRNSALDAHNYFDYSSPANPGRIPPFRRNEFGFTNGGPVYVPRLFDGRKKLFYFLEYQGFRQVLGTTQVFSVPTAQQRSGLDTSAFPGDTLSVPVNTGIAAVLARYPLPNFSAGTYGANTYATSSKVATDADQFSLRLDYQATSKSHLFARVTFDNLDGPTTNPDQTVLDESFAVKYADRQRNATLDWVYTASPHLTFDSSISGIRTTPSFNTPNGTDPAVKFNDSLFEPFNAPGGSVTKSYTNLFQFQENVTFTTSRHAFKAGGEVRLWRDSSYFGMSPNGEYDFGGGTAYSPVDISSQSGQHNIRKGDPLPDTLSAFLTGSPFAYTRAVAPSYFSNGERIGPAADNRTSFEVYAQDAWKATSRLVLNYGLRLEFYTPLSERGGRGSTLRPLSNGSQEFLINPDPVYRTYMNDWGPRVEADYRFSEALRGHAGVALTTIPTNIWQTNLLTGGLPFVFYPRITASPTTPLAYGFQIQPSAVPQSYDTAGNNIFAGRRSNDVPHNTVLDIDRLENDLAAVSGQPAPLNVQGLSPSFGNAALATWSLGLERSFGNVTTSASYVGTSAWKLSRIAFPNAYPGASAQFAHFTRFDASGSAVGGFGTEVFDVASSHSSYHSLQLSGAGQSGHGGPGLQASYTWSKSIDDTSTVAGTSVTSTVGAVSQAAPQNPFDTHPERGPSAFDITHSFTLSLTQQLPLASLAYADRLNRKLADGWQLISVSTLSSGLPFTVYSGVQQTGAGAGNVDRPDQIGKPDLSVGRKRHEDYFGRGDNNASFFYIPVGVAGGTGPNQGRFGTLGRNTFRGPAFYDFDISLVKDTPVGRRGSGGDLMAVQFRSEFFNVFNIANLGLPSNTLLGSGFGLINRTAGSSRQIQFSLKLVF